MKVKRIILSMISTLILTAVFMTQSVLAYEQGSWTFMEICAGSTGISSSNPEYAITSTNTEAGSGNYATLTQIGDSVGNRKINMYCGMANVGFESRTQYKQSQDPQKYIDEYKQKYNMSNESISSLNLYNTDTKNKILALADLMYLGDSETALDNYLRPLTYDPNNPRSESEQPLYIPESRYSYMDYDELKDEGVTLTANQVRAVQQAAIWYLTNGIDKRSLNEDNTFLYQRTTTGDYAELTDSSAEQNRFALQLYKYLLNKAEANANNSSFTNTVYLYVDNSASGGDAEQPILEIVPGSKEFDLALRKFITKIDNKNITELGFKSREPKINSDNTKNVLTDLDNENEITAKKEHTKAALPVTKGSKITYTIRIYNEGEVDGYATEVTDYLPEGLSLATNSTINNTYEWRAEGQKIKTTYLANKLLTASNRDFSKFNAQDANGKYYRDLEIECIVNNNATSSNLKNIAEITADSDDDKDSTPKNVTTNPNDYTPTNPTEGRGVEDDDDFEQLKLKEFDLALRKYIAKVGTKTFEEDGARKPDYDTSKLNKLAGDINKDGIVDEEDETIIKKYLIGTDRDLTDEQKTIADTNNDNKIDTIDLMNVKAIISGSKSQFIYTTATYNHKKVPIEVETGDIVTYKLVIYNEGEVDGRATAILDRLPEGVELKTTGSITSTKGNVYSITPDYTNNIVIFRTTGTKDLTAYAGGDTLDYDVLEFECEVTAQPDENDDKIYTNLAWIAAHRTGDETYTYQDRDSNRDGNIPSLPSDFVTTDDGYINEDKNRGKDWNKEDQYFEGQEDDDDFEKIRIKARQFDLALRKFTTKLNGVDITELGYESKEPNITSAEKTKLFDRQAKYDNGTTAAKTHNKDKVEVAVGDIVEYTIRVYNEGDISGYASVVTDYLPAGLKFKTYTKGDGSINDLNGWEADGQKITTDILKDQLINAFDGTTLDYKDLKIECIVDEKAKTEKASLMNIAEITEDKDKDGNEVKDRDSDEDNVDTDTDKYVSKAKAPTDGEGQQDDDDFEDLKLVEFDLALRKYITKVEDKDGNIVKSSEELAGRNPNMDNKIDTSKIPDTADYKHQKDPVVVKPGCFVYYNLTVYNEGDIAGFAKTITDQLPAGVKFVEVVDASNSKYTKKLYDETTNVLVLERKENQGVISAYNGTKLNSETVTIKCEVTADTKTGGDKIYTNIAWISEDYNEKGVEDRDSKPVEHPDEDKLVTDYKDIGYINEKDNKDKDLADSNEYFKGEEDDDDFEKIIIYKEPEIHKGVKTVKNQDSGYDEDVNTPHEWVINSSLPVNISNYQKYVIVDDIDYRLVYGKVTSVNIIDKDGKTVARLEEGKDYVLDYKENTSSTVSSILGTKYSGTLTLTFIDTDKTISDTLKANGGNIIEVKFNTTFAKDENGKLLSEIIGKEIPNKARLEYKNAAGDEGIPETEKPEVHTGGITLYKYKTVKNEKVALEGAEFEIFRSEADATTRANEVKEKAQKSSVKALQTAKSGKDGLVEFVGLEYGEDAMDDEKNKQADGTYDHDSSKMSTKYWIVETVAPKGYATITEPIEVSINNDTYKNEVAVLIKEEESKESTNRLIENKPLNFDLSLRKFITDVNDKAVNPSREPVVDTTNLKEGTSTTATYNHPKDPVDVVNNDVVSYTLRIFNEGQINGYASIITDDIPDGLEFLPEHDINKEYRWVMYEELKNGTEVEDESKVVELNINGSSEVKKYVETKDAKKAVIVRTDYLSREQNAEANLIKAFDGEKLDYKDVKLAFRVIEPNGSKRILINYAQISEDKDEDGNEVEDIDSTPDKWNEGEDDQDIEKLRVPEFDLALRKWVTQAIVTENGKSTVTNTGHDAWDDPEAIVKVELHRRKLSNVTVKFRYSIRVYNQGELEGYAKEITDYIPAGLKFIAADNPDWKDEGNNIISTRKLENTLLKPGEFADVEVLLTWINGNDNLGLKVNTAEISEDYNEKGVPDKDSTPDNKKPGEDDIDDAPVMLSVSTGMEATYIILGTSILLILAGGIFLIKKYVL